MVQIKVKWAKQEFDVEINVADNMETFKAQLFALTGVPPERQKITRKAKNLKDDENLAALGIAPGERMMLTGTADAIPVAPTEKVVFVEDMAPEELAKQQLPSGLHNLGNTCYLNSTLQSLRIIPELRHALAQYRPQQRREDGQPFAPTTLALRELFATLDSTPEPVQPGMFVMMFRSNFPQFAQQTEHGFAQQDAEECLTQLLNCCANCLTKPEGGGQEGPGGSPPAAADQPANAVDEIFGGKFQVTYKCLEADAEPSDTKHEDFRKVQCYISATSTTLEMGLQEFLSEKILKNSPTLGRDATYVKEARFYQLPEYLIVQLVRFCWKEKEKTKAKITRPVTFPFTLDVHHLCSDELKQRLEPGRQLLRGRNEKVLQAKRHAKQQAALGELAQPMQVDEAEEDPAVVESLKTIGNKTGWYELCSVVTHKGRDSDGGHYVSWVKHREEWLLFDDSKVTRVPEDKVKETQGGAVDWHLAYLLVYRTRTPEGAVCLPP
eukprot:TRINITY_DN8846_c0_g1_i1.p1 TRINITY_DN8846_c0_g1~~TRINITY_DN8846_c0_g1_i1.p1  ORF type:complete len:495 (-),score=131.94 TRINITY_DN8846_c0_g1_i1:37-1521(-)